MRADVRRVLDVPGANRDNSASGAGPGRRVAAAVYRQHPRAWHLHPADGTAFQSDTTVDRRVMVLDQFGAKRGLSMVFPSYAIWPHMTVFENVAFGLRVRRTGAAEVAEKVHQALDMVQMRSFASRQAAQLSGGQQQRVALARAFVFQPSVLLFDEPLSNLDAKLRARMRIELRELQHRLGITSVYLTHDLAV